MSTGCIDEDEGTYTYTVKEEDGILRGGSVRPQPVDQVRMRRLVRKDGECAGREAGRPVTRSVVPEAISHHADTGYGIDRSDDLNCQST